MLRWSRIAGMVMAVASVAGCAGAAFRDDRPDLRTLVQPVEIRLLVPQSDLYVPYDPSWKAYSAQGFCWLTIWLCPAAVVLSFKIDAGDVKAADALAVPMKDAIADIPFATRFADALSSEMVASGLRLQALHVEKTTTPGMNEAAFEASTAGSVLFVGVGYALSPDFSQIEIASRTEVFARSEGSRRALGQNVSLGDDPIRGSVLSRANAFYAKDFRYVAVLPSPARSAEENARSWASDGGWLVREAVLGGIEQATRVLGRNFGTRLWSGSPRLPKTRTREGKSARLIEEIPGKGRLLELGGDQLLFEAALSTARQAPR